MGMCMSSNIEEAEQKKKSQAIDKILEEDSKRLRRECKILLLGMYATHIAPLYESDFVWILTDNHINHIQAPARAASRPL
jgi:hypothetical protein